MAIFAIDDDDLIHASDAEASKIYWCQYCFGPLKRRKGKLRFAHFYHLKTTPTCRLYSKSEDHLVAQLEIKKKFPEGALQMERPFLQINRVGDLCWEAEKIVFEIQCSQMSEKEAQMRTRDYRSIGYDVVWLLDDRYFNKKISRPAEHFFRKNGGYYLHTKTVQIYDQFEIFSEKRRIRKGKKMAINLEKMMRRKEKFFDPKIFPEQLIQLQNTVYFFGDRLHRAYQNHILSMLNWRALEIQLTKELNESKSWSKRFFRAVADEYTHLLKRLLRGH